MNPTSFNHHILWLASPVSLGLVLFCLTAGPLTSVSNAQDELLTLEQEAFQRAIALAAPSVVQIETFGGLEQVGNEVVADGPTTGTIVSDDGWIIASLFSFRNQPASILITLPDGNRVSAEIVARDFSRELALLKVNVDQSLPVADPADVSSVSVGQWCIALGKTYDKSSVSQSVGIVSALGRAYGRAIQTDAKVSPINYGGPLIDLRGQVIGVLSPISPGEFLEGDSSQLYDSGIGFAIPLSDIQARLPRMQSGKDIHLGLLGIVAKDQNELSGPVELSGAAPGSPAAKAGVKAGDIIVEAEGQPVELLADLRHALAQVDAGNLFRFTIQRGEQTLQLQGELIQEIPVYRRRYLGIEVIQEAQVLTITSIAPNSPASISQLTVGQKILSCNGQAIRSKADLASILAVAELDAPVQFAVQDGERAAQEVAVSVGTWPETIRGPLAAVSREGETPPMELTEMSLGDVPNAIHALIPPQAATEQVGALILFPEPGDFDAAKLKLHWEAFSRDYGWIIVCPTSANPTGWSRDELELASRLLGRFEQQFQLDPTRIALGGAGAGGRLALMAAGMERNRVMGAITLGTDLKGFGIRQPNAPLQSLDFLFAGDTGQLQPVAEQLSSKGFVANVLNSEQIDPQKWETFPLPQVFQWLEGLGRL